ncbi:2-phospho-L-lactate guanylyltransferase [Agromyces sp. H66]|uniref:2-phospho-L-lactate guanylyltransferase n=1 Tax=Agromyces sp. H66 TaxID=2529859 RepID=UPI0010AB1AF9|nr:2-phospho-L-lactate guanylyltransferase [Agromyces sp. H66]
MRWTLVIPVKAPASGKSRLVPGVTDAARAALARAFALDTVAAARAARSVEHVIVVGDDPDLADGAEFLAEPGADGNPGSAAERGLLPAIRHGIAHARAGSRGAAGSLLDPRPREVAVAVLLGDLPALKPAELDAALDAATRHPLAFVRDADGTGTTLATAAAGVPFEPQFGSGSAARHVAAGFVELEASAAPGLTHDVDTVDGLETVLHHGVGEHTADVVAHLADRKGIA